MGWQTSNGVIINSIKENRTIMIPIVLIERESIIIVRGKGIIKLCWGHSVRKGQEEGWN